MTAQKPVLRQHGNAYNIFVLVMTVYSLGLMVLLILPLSQGTKELANTYDNVACVFFLMDFAYNLSGSRPKRGYFFGQLGWIDLLGSIPTVPWLPLTALFRLFRIFRLVRIVRILRRQNQKEVLADIVKNRGQYALFITATLVLLVLVTGSILVLQFESVDPDSNIRTGGDALWWSIVTITTVGYGDYFPVTALGRLTAVFIMFAGIGVIGALASLLASVLVGGGSSPEEAEDAGAPAGADGAGAAPAVTAVAVPAVAAKTPAEEAASLAAIQAELVRLRAEVASLRDDLKAPST